MFTLQTKVKNYTNFDEIQLGRFFMYNNNVYLKIQDKEPNTRLLALSLQNLRVCEFMATISVKPLILKKNLVLEHELY